jgi:hypothetical protein
MLLLSIALARPPSAGFLDSTTHPIRCQYEHEKDKDRCALLLQYAELAWEVQIEELGFNAPLPDGNKGGSEALDIYFGTSETSEAGEAWVDCDGGDGHCNDTSPDDQLAAAPSYIVIDSRTEDEILPGYMVHEFQHTTQYATDWAEPFLDVWEGTAVLCEMRTLPDVPTSISDMQDYQADPWLSAVLQDGYDLWDLEKKDSWYEYGAVLWMRWLDERYGNGAVRLWEAMGQEGNVLEPDVLDGWEELADMPWTEEFLAFAADRGRMGTQAGPDYALEAPVARASLTTGEAKTARKELYPLGSVYFELEVEPGAELLISLEADPALLWGLVFVEEGEEGEQSWGLEASYTVKSKNKLLIGVVNAGVEGMDADDPLEPAGVTILAQQKSGCGCQGGAAFLLVPLLLGRRYFQPTSNPTTGRTGRLNT